MGWYKNRALLGSLKQIRSGRDDGYESLNVALQSGADPNAFLEKGLTPLMIAMFLDHGMFVASILCNYGADPFKKDKRGKFNAIQLALDQGFDGYAEMLELKGTNQAIKNKFRLGKTS